MDNTKLKNRMTGKVQELQQPVDVAAAPNVSLAPASSSYLALANNALDIIRANLKSQPLTLDLFDIVKSPSGGSIVFSVPGLAGDEPAKELTGIVLDYVTPRAYWNSPDPVEGTPPVCMSQNSIISHDGKACAHCPLSEVISMGYTSHQARTCGLHIHVNRTAFGSTEAVQDACIARILYFFEKNWEELLKFSRRSQHQLEQWAARYGYKDQPQDILDHAKKGGGRGRYSCVNLQNRDTIEFRMFRGTLTYNTLIATLQLVDRVCEVALNLSDIELKELSWTTFVSGCTAPELVQYLKERRLYVNEPIEGEAEV